MGLISGRITTNGSEMVIYIFIASHQFGITVAGILNHYCTDMQYLRVTFRKADSDD